MNITYGNTINVTDYCELRKAVGWLSFSEKQAQTGLDHSAYVVAAYEGDRTVGMARLLYDGGYMALIADVVVHPDYQKHGIGKTMLTMIMSYLDSVLEPGEVCYVSLMAAEGKEGFYQKFGFTVRPNEHLGAGMTQWIRK